MNHLLDVYRELHNCGVFFFERKLSFTNEQTAASTIECDGAYGIFVDTSRIHSKAEETVAVAHEAGHCITGSTHKLCSPYDLIERHENDANRWACRKLIPVDELDEAVASGITELWELAEHFNVTEDFMKKAVCLHTYGNLAVDCYF